MDYPLQLKFFKKLEFFQTLNRLDQQFNRMHTDSVNVKPTWELEKKLLRWTYLGHKHLGTPLDPERYDKSRAQHDTKVKQDIESIGATIEEFASGRNTYALQNLVARGFATLANKRAYHLYKNGKEDLTVEKGIYDGIQGEHVAGGAPQEVKGGIYLTEDGLIMGELLSEIAYLRELPENDQYKKNYNANYRLTYYRTAYWYYELLILIAWITIFCSLIIIASQASARIGTPDNLRWFIPFIKPVLQYLVVLPPILFIVAFMLGCAVQLAQSIRRDR